MKSTEELIKEAENELSTEELIKQAEAESASTQQEMQPVEQKSNLFPNATNIKNPIGKGVAGAFDLLSSGTRALGTLRNDPATGKPFEMSNPNSKILQPTDIINAPQENIDRLPLDARLGAESGKLGLDMATSFVSDPFALIGGLAGLAKKPVTSMMDNVTQKLTGTPIKALRFASSNAGSKMLQAASGTESTIGKDLAHVMQNYDKLMPEGESIKQSLSNMGNINMAPILNKIDKLKADIMIGSPSAEQAVSALDHYKKLWEKLSTKDIPASKILDAKGNPIRAAGKESIPISATNFRELRGMLDDEIEKVFKVDPHAATILENKGKELRSTMKKTLEDQAVKTGNPQYVKDMKIYSDNLKKLDDLKAFLGGRGVKLEAQSQRLIDNIMSKNKNVQQEALQKLGDVVGKDFLGQAKLAQLAEQVGNEGKTSWLPNYGTGAGLLGIGSFGRVVGGIIGSPKIASKVTLPLMDKTLAGLEGLKKLNPQTQISSIVSQALSKLIDENKKKEEDKTLRKYYTPSMFNTGKI